MKKSKFTDEQIAFALRQAEVRMPDAEVCHIRWISQLFPAMFLPSDTCLCHHSRHLFAKTDESQHTGIAQQLSDRPLKL